MAPSKTSSSTTKAKAKAATKPTSTTRNRVEKLSAKQARLAKLVQVGKGRRGIGRADDEFDDDGDETNDSTTPLSQRSSRRTRSNKTSNDSSASAANSVVTPSDSGSGPSQDAGNVPEYSFVDIDQILEEQQAEFDNTDLNSIAQSAAGVVFDGVTYPALPEIDGPGSTAQDYDALFNDPMFAEAFQDSSVGTQATTPYNFDTADDGTGMAATMGELRPVPRVKDVGQKIEEGGPAYENKIRIEEGKFRSNLHHLVIMQTRKNSYRARQVLPDRENDILDKIKNELDPYVLNFNDSWFEGLDNVAKPFSERLHSLLFSALLLQPGLDTTVFDANQYTDECFLEARVWTLEKMIELIADVKQQIEDSEHLRTTRQSHLELA